MPNSVLHLRVTRYPKGGQIPPQHATEEAGGKNISIGFQWEPWPAAHSYAVLMEDLHPIANRWVHWLVADISPETSQIPEGASRTPAMPLGSRELETSWGRAGYDGPQPPVGSGPHEYVATLFALDIPTIGFPAKNTRQDFLDLIEGHVLAQESWSGFFER